MAKNNFTRTNHFYIKNNDAFVRLKSRTVTTIETTNFITFLLCVVYDNNLLHTRNNKKNNNMEENEN